jgi:hypothetical protein
MNIFVSGIYLELEYEGGNPSDDYWVQEDDIEELFEEEPPIEEMGSSYVFVDEEPEDEEDDEPDEAEDMEEQYTMMM